MDLARADLPGFIEHARGGVWMLFKSAWRTWAWAMLPWIFWRKIRVEHQIVPKRWLVWAVLTLGAVLVLTWSVDGITQTAARAIKIADHTRFLANHAQHPSPPLNTTYGGSPAGAFPGPPPELWSTGHVVSMLDRWLFPFTFLPQRPIALEYAFIAKPGKWKGTDGTELVPELMWVFWPSSMAFTEHSSFMHAIGRLPPTLVPTVAWHVMFGLVLLTLPTTRKLARVRRWHVLRAFVFGIAWWPGVAVTVFLLISETGLLGLVNTINRGGEFLGSFQGVPVSLHISQVLQLFSGVVVTIFVPLHTLIWWPLAILRGWRFKQGWLVVAIVAIPAGITAFGAAVFWQIARTAG